MKLFASKTNIREMLTLKSYFNILHSSIAGKIIERFNQYKSFSDIISLK